MVVQENWTFCTIVYKTQMQLSSTTNFDVAHSKACGFKPEIRFGRTYDTCNISDNLTTTHSLFKALNLRYE